MSNSERKIHMHAKLSPFVAIILISVVGSLSAQSSIEVRHCGAHAGAEFGAAVSAAGDVNGDGFDDDMVGSPKENLTSQVTGVVRVYFGSDHSLIRVHNAQVALVAFGRDLCGLGDIDGDSRTREPTVSFGRAVAAVGDLDLDGIRDHVVGAPDEIGPIGAAGSATVFSGAAGVQLFKFYGDHFAASFGSALADAGDVDGDGDGWDDILVGAPDNSAVANPFPPSTAQLRGIARVLSGFDGSTIQNFVGAIKGDQCPNDEGLAEISFSPPSRVTSFSTDLSLTHFLTLQWIPSGGPNALSGGLILSGATPGGLGFRATSLNCVDENCFGFLPVLLSTQIPFFRQQFDFGFDLNFGYISVGGISLQIPAIAGLTPYMQGFEIYPQVTSSNGLRIQIAA